MSKFDTEFTWYAQPVRNAEGGKTVVYKIYFWSPIPFPEMTEWCDNNLKEQATVSRGGGAMSDYAEVVFAWRLTVIINNKDDMFLFKMIWS